MNEILEDPLDVNGFCIIFQRIYLGAIKCIAVDTPLPSVFAHEILSANPYAFLDDAPLEERRTRAVSMRRLLPNSALSELAKLDQEIIDEVSLQAWPDIRSKEELHDVLVSLVVVPEHMLNTCVLKNIYFDELIASRRAAKVLLTIIIFIILQLNNNRLSRRYILQVLVPEYLAHVKKAPINRDSAVLELIKQWMYVLGPTSCA